MGRVKKNNQLISLVVGLIFFSFNSFAAYDPCKVKQTMNHYAESLCYNVNQSLVSPYNETQFNIRAVFMTKDMSSYKNKDTVILIPGGPGSDSQSIGMGFNDKGLLNALWAHLDLNVVLYDPRSTGASVFLKDAQFYPQEVFSNENQVRDLKKVVETISPDKPVYLLAHSAGGNVASKLTALYPHLVKGLVMFSASVDNRQIGESNLRLFAKESKYFNQKLETILSEEEFVIYKSKISFIENFLINSVKLIRISKVKHVELRDLYIRKFRSELVVAIENDLIDKVSKNSITLINSWYSTIKELPAKVIAEVNSQQDLQFNSLNHTPSVLRRSNWIKTANICGEGLTKSEILEPMWLDGLSLQEDICYSVKAKYLTPPSRSWLSKIKVKSLFIGGQQDPRQIPSDVIANSKLVQGAELLIIKDAGHEAFKTHANIIYKKFEEFFLGE